MLEERVRRFRLTLTLEPCTYAGTPVVSHVMPSVGRSVTSAEHQAVSLLLPALRHQPPVDPAGHDSVGMAAAVRREVAPTSLLRTLGSTSAYPNGLYRHSSGASSLRFPSSWLLRAVRCRHLVLPPTQHGR